MSSLYESCRAVFPWQENVDFYTRILLGSAAVLSATAGAQAAGIREEAAPVRSAGPRAYGARFSPFATTNSCTRTAAVERPEPAGITSRRGRNDHSATPVESRLLSDKSPPSPSPAVQRAAILKVPCRRGIQVSWHLRSKCCIFGPELSNPARDLAHPIKFGDLGVLKLPPNDRRTTLSCRLTIRLPRCLSDSWREGRVNFCRYPP